MAIKLSLSPVDLCIAKAGSVQNLAAIVGVSRQAILEWRKKDRIPLGRVPEVARKLSIKKEVLAPDFFR